MYKFPEGLYVDIRIEEVYTTNINYKKDVLEEVKVRKNEGAFIRIFDGEKWYYTSTSDLESIQTYIDDMASNARPNPDIDEDPIVSKFEVNNETILKFQDKKLMDIPLDNKIGIVRDYLSYIKDPLIVNYTGRYMDKYILKTIYTSKGTKVSFDKQLCGVRFSYEFKDGDKTDLGRYSKAGTEFQELYNQEDKIVNDIKKSVEFLKEAQNVEPGKYTVIFNPATTGVFTHESFGHKSESDFMVGDENMKKEWAIGKPIGTSMLNIIEDGSVIGSGYTIYDDEGTKARKNYIIKDGILSGRLHSTETAAVLEESLTGNARAINFEFEPIVRMTSTYIDKGNRPFKEILAETKEGIYVEDFNHGSGMSTFTIAPRRAYKIEDGKLTVPLKVSVITGSVFEALNNIDALSEEFEIMSFVGGGCGKMEQYPLEVSFGGPYMRVNNMGVQ